jgi:hypothetical protein
MTAGRTTMLAVLATLIGTAPALAYDLTGTWTGTRKCQDLFEGAKEKFTDTVTFAISQNGNVIGIQVAVAGVAGTTNYTALANFPAAKPDKGEFATIHCGTNDVVGDSLAFDAIGRMKASTKTDKVKAKVSGTTFFSDTDAAHPGLGTCKWSLTRTATTDPGVSPTCPSAVPSRRAVKKNIQYLSDADVQKLHDDLLRFKLASWQYMLPGASDATHVGFIIDDVEPSPSIAENGTTVDLYGYASMAVAAVQTQQREIDELKREVAELRKQVPAKRRR